MRAFLASIPWEQGDRDKWEGALGWETGGLIAWLYPAIWLCDLSQRFSLSGP